MMKRDIIHDTFNIMLEEGLEVDDSGNTITLTDRDFDALKQCTKELKRLISKSDDDPVYVFNGCSYYISRHFSKISIDDDYIKMDLLLRKDKNKVRLTYSLFKHSTSKLPSLSFTGNPTTLINGHNTTSLMLNDDPFKELKFYYQVPFTFLFDIMGFKPSRDLNANLEKLMILTNNVQWAMYIPCSNKVRTLNALKLIYARQSVDINNNKHIELLCNYLGFEYASDQTYNNGFMLIKKHKQTGKVLTINFYDKTMSNLSKGISGLNDEETIVTDTSLRLDITAHREFIYKIINDAKRNARRLIETGNNLPKGLTTKDVNTFLEFPSDKAWAYSLVIAILLLSVKIDKDGKRKKYSFSDWLKDTILVNMMKLDKLLVFNGKIDTSGLTKSEMTLFNKWRNNEQIQRSDKDTVSRLENKLGLSLKLPYAMLESIIMLDSVQGLSKKRRNKFIELSCKRDNNCLTTSEAVELATLARESARNLRNDRLIMAETFGINLLPPPTDLRKIIKT